MWTVDTTSRIYQASLFKGRLATQEWTLLQPMRGNPRLLARKSCSRGSFVECDIFEVQPNVVESQEVQNSLYVCVPVPTLAKRHLPAPRCINPSHFLPIIISNRRPTDQAIRLCVKMPDTAPITHPLLRSRTRRLRDGAINLD